MSVLNFNLGVLGHIDSGKTTLAKALSTVASTACFDKNPQSKERGITLDLGFSSFAVDFPHHLINNSPITYDRLQFTLVDCPGHASLIKTIIAGAQIIDLMMLIIDVTKGMQTQTAECLVIGEITCGKMIVVLNKIDLIPEAKRQISVDKMTKKIQLTLKNTVFKDSPVIAVSATSTEDSGLPELMKILISSSFIPKRNSQGSLLFAVDHCFPIKGQGTVMTGTVLQGRVSVNDVVEIPLLKSSRKVKSMQMFRQPVESAMQGDRLGICVTQFDAKLLERGIVCAPGSLPTAYGLIINIEKIIYYKQSIKNKSKYHITLGHETVMAKVNLFQSPNPQLDFDCELPYIEEIEENKNDYNFALLQLERPVPVIPNSLVIGSKLDADIHSNSCRIAFKGTIQLVYDRENYMHADLPRLKVFKTKQKQGFVERMSSPYEVIARNLLKKETNIQLFTNLRVLLSTGETGIIEGSFGQSGKVKIRIMDGLQSSTQSTLAQKNKKKPAESDKEQVTVTLAFKRYVYDPCKRMIQT